MKLQLTITVEYKPNGVPEPVLREVMNQAAEHLADNGLLTGNTDAEVESCTHEVTIAQ